MDREETNKDDNEKLSSSSSLSSLDSESGCHTVVTTSSSSIQDLNVNPSGITCILQQAEERKEEKEAQFSEVATRYRRENCVTEYSKTVQIRIACRMEYGLTGWVDPRKVAHKKGVPVEDVVSWLRAQPNYAPIDKPDVVGYVQRVIKPKVY